MTLQRDEYIPNVRHRDDLPAIINDVLAGECESLRELDVQPGTLTLLNGYRSMHRVAPVCSSPSRRMLTLSYDSAPGQHFGEEIHMRFFGRRQLLATAGELRGADFDVAMPERVSSH